MKCKNKIVKEKLPIEKQIDETLHLTSKINEVKVSPFFKERTLNKIFTEKEIEQKAVFSWFSPKFQLATLACLIVLNVIAFTHLNTEDYDDEINDFAETYGLTTETETLLFN